MGMRRVLSRVLWSLGAILLVVFAGGAFLVFAPGEDQPIGSISDTPRDRSRVDPEAGRGAGKQILFGDLHVHTTYSLDAFFTSMPLLSGEGAHPPADACDYARHCAALDFYAITDHAQELTPEHWALEKQANRQCNAVGQTADGGQDLVVFHGFEWTQIGRTPEQHYGHKNVIFRGLGEDEVTPRPITALGGPEEVNPWVTIAPIMSAAALIDPLNRETYGQFKWMFEQLQQTPECDPSVPTRELPLNCREAAPTPDILFEKLDEWDYDAMVIPHGTAWGSYSPPGTDIAKQLRGGMHDPGRQKLIEVFSGHGNSEQYQSWREFTVDEEGQRVCPAETAEYLPCCRRAGQIMRSRCGDLPAAECDRRVDLAISYALEAGIAFDGIFPDTGAAEWLDCGQARSGFKPDYSLRPLGTAQYALALSPGGADNTDDRFRFGFIGSSDSHTARAATGFKQTGGKRGLTDMVGPRNEFYANLLAPRGKMEDPQMPLPSSSGIAGALAIERTGSFLYPGGVVAVHAAEHSRQGIWDALERRETYATSGPRILLWFDLLQPDGDELPMGSMVETEQVPTFRVRAMGAPRQAPGCPEDTYSALTPERIDSLCMGECYHPTDQRHFLTAIEVVRVRPQIANDESVDQLIEDPWRILACPAQSETCVAEFSDEEFAASGRDAVYYVRALQEPTAAVNADNLRTRFDAQGAPVAVDPCGVAAVSRPGDDCVGEAAERAWSSPIFVDYGPGSGTPTPLPLTGP
jgi:hypothetical protein